MNLNRRVIAAVTLGLVCFVLTIAIFVQVKTTNTSNSTVAQTMEENDLRDQVLRMKEKYDNVYEELGNATKRLEQIRVDATKDDSEAKEKQKELEKILLRTPQSSKKIILDTIDSIRINLSKERIPGSIDILLEEDYKELISSRFLWSQIEELSAIKDDTQEIEEDNFNLTPEYWNMGIKEIMDYLHDFFKYGTNKKTWEIFQKIYNENKKSIRFINGDALDYTGEIIYLEFFKKFYIMGCRQNEFEDIMTFAHEFGHAIQFATNYKTSIYNELNIYIEIISIFFELICNEYFINNFKREYASLNYNLITLCLTLKPEKNKIIEIINKVIQIKANETLTTLRKNIDELLEVLTKEDISHIMTLRPARDYIYVIAFNIATNLFMIYKNDPDYAFYLVYKIINLDLNMNKEEYFKQLQSLDITNIKNTKEYNELILSRCRSIQK